LAALARSTIVAACLVVIVLLAASSIALAGAVEGGRPEPVPDVYESYAAPTADTKIDKLVFANLRQLHIKPVLCSDAVFVRRAYLDVIGTLPGAQEAR